MRFSDKIHLSVLLSAVLLAAGCVSLDINLPAITEAPTGERSPGKIVWRDLLTNDPAASQRFYGELFGWKFEGIGPAYTLIRHNGKMIGGMIDTVALNGRDDISQWVVLMSVEDVDAGTRLVEESGGRVITPAIDVQPRGRLAVVRDAEGALLALLRTRDGDSLDSEAEEGSFLWDELWTTDVDNASTFYSNIAGLEPARIDIDADQETAPTYRLLKAGDRPQVGIMPNPLDGLDPVWVSYLRVADPAAITAKVADLGGRVIVEAQDRPIGGQVAFIAGPSGAGIALQTWPLEKPEPGDTN